MKNVLLKDILAVLHTSPSGELSENIEITEIVTDSRAVGAGCVFVCINGERVDGHDYAEQALASGAVLVIAERDLQLQNQVVVPSSMEAIQKIATWYDSVLPLKKIAITGSVGKTTTKDMVAAVLSASYNVGKTLGNANNELGLPKTIFSLDNTMDYAVLEMGMTALGDIEFLCKIAPPHVGIITNIGMSHIGRLGSRENILRAKLELAHALPNGATLLLCGDDDMLNTVNIPHLNILRYGFSPECDIQYTTLEVLECTQRVYLKMGENTCTVELPIGRHIAEDAAASFAVGILENMSTEKIAEGLHSYMPSGMRQSIVEVNGRYIVEDCYNASPESMRAALESLSTMPCKNRRIAILSDMLELGGQSEQQHILIGSYATKHADIVVACGDMSAYYATGAEKEGGRVITAGTMPELAELLANLSEAGDILWFKASRGMKLEQAVNRLYEILENA